MDQTAGLALRWLRAVLLGAVAMATGLAAHVSANGRLTGPAALAVVLLVTCVGAALVLGRPASALRIVGIVTTGQLFVHGALTSMVGHRGDAPLVRGHTPPPLPMTPTLPVGAPGGRRVGSLFAQTYAGRSDGQHPQLVLPDPVQHLLADLTGPHAAMAVAHLVAAALLGWWLARGERLLWNVVALTAAGATDLGRTTRHAVGSFAHSTAVLAQTLSLAQGPVGTRGSTPPASLACRGRLLSCALVRRGPPAPCAA